MDYSNPNSIYQFKVIAQGVSGEISDPYNGNTISYNNLDEFYEAVAKLDEERKKQLKERARAELLLSSVGTPEQVERIYNATAPDEKKDPKEYIQAFVEEKNSAVADAVKAHASMMTLSELEYYAGTYPGLQSILQERLAALRKLGYDSQDGQGLTARDIAVAEQDIKSLRDSLSKAKTRMILY